MQILTANQIRAWDQFTIVHTPIKSIDLMEKAAKAFCQQFQLLYTDKEQSISIFCGPGNNGGDGLAVARILHFAGYHVRVIICHIGNQRSPDFQINSERLPKHDTLPVFHLRQDDNFKELPKANLVIDAIFGSGLNRPIEAYWAGLVKWINAQVGKTVAIDIPSGLQVDGLQNGPAVKATHTISFQVPKLAYFFSENSPFVGQWSITDIGLHPDFLRQTHSSFRYQTFTAISKLLKTRQVFSHKGTFGHALLIAGSRGMMGAAQLTAKACLRSGPGLLTVFVPKSGNDILQISVPEAMTIADNHPDHISEVPQLDRFQAIGIGPGLGKAPKTQSAVKQLLKEVKVPIVLDADALNILSQHPSWLQLIPKHSILTPHPGEFRRLFGKSKDSKAELLLLQQKAQDLQVIILLKGAYTRIASPEGLVYFNSTGNPGMATGGSGDVLTGILTGLLAQGYTSLEAALIGAYLHGKAGDIAAIKHHPIAMKAGDIIEAIGAAYRHLINPTT